MPVDTKVAIHVGIREMRVADLKQVCLIEQGVYARPRKAAYFVRALNRRRCRGLVAVRVASQQEALRVDYGCARKDLPVVAFLLYYEGRKLLSILDLVVDIDHQGLGIGRTLARPLAVYGGPINPAQKPITARVHERQTEAQLFFKALGFRAISVVRRYYANPEGDCYVFAWSPAIGRFTATQGGAK